MAYDDVINTSAFNKQNKKHDSVMAQVIEAFKQRGFLCTVPSNNTSKAEHCDLCLLKNPYYIRCTVRVDAWIGKTGNLYLENSLTRHKRGFGTDIKSLGWFAEAKTDKLVYVDTVNSLIYVFDLNKVKKFVKEHQDDAALVKHRFDENRFDRDTTVEVFIVNLKDLKDASLLEDCFPLLD